MVIHHCIQLCTVMVEMHFTGTYRYISISSMYVPYASMCKCLIFSDIKLALGKNCNIYGSQTCFDEIGGVYESRGADAWQLIELLQDRSRTVQEYLLALVRGST